LNNFYWKCAICKEPIKDNLVEKWIDGRKARYHKACLSLQEELEREADRIIRKVNGKH
jgi:hypothetical protein